MCIVTRGDAAMFPLDLINQVRGEAARAHKILGARDTIFLEGFPAALLDTVPHSHLNKAIAETVRSVAPEVLFVPFNGDLHLDHRLIFDSALVAARPHAAQTIRRIYAYETLSETNWYAPFITPAFTPNVFVDISDFLETKLEAMRQFESQLKPFPDERSLEAIESLARMRGATVGAHAAESFVLIRAVHDKAKAF